MEAVYAAIEACLTPHERQIMELILGRNAPSMSPAEVSRELNVSRQAVSNAYRSACRKLRHRLNINQFYQ
jgi:DNA-directed RNA polymerase specialized sigma subunit